MPPKRRRKPTSATNAERTPPLSTSTSTSTQGDANHQDSSSLFAHQHGIADLDLVTDEHHKLNGHSHAHAHSGSQGGSSPRIGHPTNEVDASSGFLVDQPQSVKKHNFLVRTITTFLMIGGFMTVLAAGHFWVIVMISVIQTLVYKEVIQIAQVPSREKKLPWFKAINWYFLLSTNYFLYGESLIHYFKQFIAVDGIMPPLVIHHRFISFVLYLVGFIVFVANLKKGHYKFQIQQFCWTHMALLLVIVQSHFMINNIFEGMIWLVLPVSLVISNDIFAYICGFFWGRRQLIKLSPKKTVEGFVGGLVCTIIFAGLAAAVLSGSDYMICPVKDLLTRPFSTITCGTKNPVFEPEPWELPSWVQTFLARVFFVSIKDVMIKPIMFHAFVMACFASLIAPFGGFFASGVKRAFKIKDFGQTIPGHGGLTDRMDCQFFMGLFSYMYYQSFIKTYANTASIGSVFHTISTDLSREDQIELFNKLVVFFEVQKLLAPSVVECLSVAAKESGIWDVAT